MVTRDAMDACVEAGEKRRFLLNAQCSRFKRLYQSCLIEAADDCAKELHQLHDCVQQALAKPPL